MSIGAIGSTSGKEFSSPGETSRISLSSKRSALRSVGSAGLIAARRPLYTRYVVSPALVRIICSGDAARMSSPSTGLLASTVVSTTEAGACSVTEGGCVESHTVHDDIAMSSPPLMLLGEPTIPTAGPSATVLRNLSSACFGGWLFP